MAESNPYLSVVSPVFLAEGIVDELVKRITEEVSKITQDYEILLVEDGSSDKSWKKIEDNCKTDKRIKGIKLSRNFGQHYAITAGLKESRGDYVVVMDCDLQDDPSFIPSLLEKAQTGFDVVVARRINRQDTTRKRLSSIAFHSIFSYMTNKSQDSSIGNFGIYHRKVIDSVLAMGDYSKFFPAQIQWVGFKQTTLSFPHSARFSGTSSYSWRRLLNLASNNILAFSDKPLRLAVVFGFFVSLVSFVLGIMYLFLGILGAIQVSGFVTVIATLFMSTGSIIMVIGVVGVYVGKTFEASKNRPLYLIEDKF